MKDESDANHDDNIEKELSKKQVSWITDEINESRRERKKVSDSK